MTTYEVFPQYFTSNQFNIPDNFDANYNILPGGNGIPDILNEANWGLMFFTNVQSTPNEPAGAVAFGTDAYNAGPAWGANMDMDTSIYTTITNTGWSCGLAAGAFMQLCPAHPTLQSHAQRGLPVPRGRGLQRRGRAPDCRQEKLYYNIQYYLLTGNTTASNYIEVQLHQRQLTFTNTL